VNAGFKGTFGAWLASLKGEVGAVGATGAAGATGGSNIVYSFGCGSVTPSNSSTYYIGGITDLPPGSSNIISRQIPSQFTGQVTEVSILRFTPSGPLGTSESSTFNMVNVTQSTSSVISNSVTTNSGNGIWDNYVLASPLSVTAGDSLQITWNTPVWVTPPTTVRLLAHVKITY
jgi:hypothetical protein